MHSSQRQDNMQLLNTGKQECLIRNFQHHVHTAVVTLAFFKKKDVINDCPSHPDKMHERSMANLVHKLK